MMTDRQARRRPAAFDHSKASEHAVPGLIICPRCNGLGNVPPETLTVGDRFFLCRDRDGRSQAEIAPFLKITRQALARIEGDKGKPGLTTLLLAADLYQVSVDFLLGRGGE